MENKQPTFLDLLLEAHIGLDRQGPGSPETVKRALSFLGPLERFEQIADLGCGTGGQTMLLAEQLSGAITGLDKFPAVIDAFNSRAKQRGYGNRIKGIVGDMADLPFQKGSLDLIWSEGAIDNIGFREGLDHWHGFLKKGGSLAVSCPSWITKDQPAAVEQFWSEAGSHLDPVERNIEIMGECGYRFIAAFVLSEECWTEHYFIPREQAIHNLLKKYDQCETAKTYAALNRQEVELYLAYKQHYGYVFYIGQAV